MGISNYNPDHPCSINDLLTRADALMYEDKKRSKTKPLSVKQEKERRTYKRFSPGANYAAALDGTVKMRIKDISMGGICLRTIKPLQVNSIHEIHMISPDNEEIAPRGMIVWSSRNGSKIKKERKSRPKEAGVRFIQLSANDKKYLKKIIHSLDV